MQYFKKSKLTQKKLHDKKKTTQNLNKGSVPSLRLIKSLRQNFFIVSFFKRWILIKGWMV